MRLQRLRLTWLVTAAALWSGCGDAPGFLEVASQGDFAYRAYHDDGRLLLIGSLQVKIRDDSTVIGTWQIQWAPGADTTVEVGPQIGADSLVGTLAAGAGGIWISLNPGWADYNVFLQGRQTDRGHITGRWWLSTLLGETATGPFELRR